MNRCLGWAMLVVAGMVLGCAIGAYQNTRAAAQEAGAEKQDAEVADQLKEIKTQVKEINSLLQSGTLKVVVVINPNR
jgi:hypothetical protein